jgi:hypothetical protein
VVERQIAAFADREIKNRCHAFYFPATLGTLISMSSRLAMRRRRWLILAISFMVVTAVMSYLARRGETPDHRINEGSSKLISKGMTQKDLEAIFGVPPGNYEAKQTSSYTLQISTASGLFPPDGNSWRPYWPRDIRQEPG